MPDRRTIVAPVPINGGGRRLSRLGAAVAFGLAVAVWPGHGASAHAATVMVTTLADSGPGSLRQAIADAAPGDTITFASIASSGTITLTSGQLTIGKSLTIDGPGVAALTISGNNMPRVFAVAAGATVQIAGLTIANGSPSLSSSGAAGYLGGGVDNSGALTLDSAVLRDNLSGAIDNTGALTVSRTLISHNSGNTRLPFPAISAGGIANTSIVTVTSSTIADNTAGAGPGFRYGNPAPGADGGGIANGAGGTLTIANSTIYGNKAGVGGSNDDGSPTGRSGVGGNGGGVSNAASASATILDSTIVGNAAGEGATPRNQYDDPGMGGSGGGIYNAPDPSHNSLGGSLTVARSIVAGNAVGSGGHPRYTGDNGPDGTSPDCNGFQSGGDTLIDNIAGCSISGDTIGDILNQDPLLGPLQNNGGSTPTLLPFAGSPAIDQIPPDRCGIPTDQRGDARPADSGTGRTYCDIGAVEAQSGEAGTPPPASATPELGSGELLATGLLPLGLAALARRRRARRARQR